MNSSRQDNDTQKGCLAYKYKTIVSITPPYTHQATPETIIEYFIPSLNICFNKYHIYKSNQPRNILDDSHHVSVLTAAQLTSSLSEELQSRFMEIVDIGFNFPMSKNGHPEDYPELPLNNKGEYLSLISNNKYEYDNEALLKDIINYIRNGDSLTAIDLNQIYQSLDSLDAYEKESLKTCINFYCGMNNGKLINREIYINQLDDQAHPITSTLAGGGIGLFATLSARNINPLIGFGLGGLGGYTFSSLKTQYDKAKVSQLCDVIEDRARFILNKLTGEHRHNSPVFYETNHRRL